MYATYMIHQIVIKSTQFTMCTFTNQNTPTPNMANKCTDDRPKQDDNSGDNLGKILRLC